MFVANTRAVELLSAAKVSSASPQIDAPARIASVPLDSNGARKSILPKTSLSTTVSSAVDRFSLPAPVAPVPVVPRISA